MTRAQDATRISQRYGGIRAWALLLVLLLLTATAPMWIPYVMGGVPAKPSMLASPPRHYVLRSPWDRVQFSSEPAWAAVKPVPLHNSFPIQVDARAFRTTGGEPNVRGLVRPAFAALGRLTSESDVALSQGDRAAAHRVLLALDYWAQNDAFAGSPRKYLEMTEYLQDPPICDLTGEPWNIRPPEPLRSWSSSFIQLGPNGYGEPFFLSKIATGAAISFLQIRNAISPTCEEALRVQAWFGGELMNFQKEFAILCFQSRQLTDHVGRPLPQREMMLWGWEGAHNKVFCSLLAVAALAIAADDQQNFQWAMTAFDFALNQIDADGTHRATLYEKGDKALLYHNFIADSIVPLAVLADANGYRFLSDPRLTAFVRRVITSLDQPDYFETVTGMPQHHGRFFLAGTSGWTVIYSAYVDDPDVRSVGSPARLVHPLFAGSGRRWGGHPRFWAPAKVSPWNDWIGLAQIYVWVVGIVLIGCSLAVASWLQRRRCLAVLSLIPLVWPLTAVILLRRARPETCEKKPDLRERVIAILLLTMLVSAGIGFFWTYALLRIV